MTKYRDGIINKDFFNKSKIKILWILKEVNHDGEIDDWDMSIILQNLKTKNGIKSGWEKTFATIVYTTFGILNKKLWDEIPYHYDNPEIIDILKEIAYINVNKTSGGSTTHYLTLEKAYLTYKEKLFQQINEINPSVIIYGGTFYLFENDLNSNIINKTIKHIDAYHPAQRKISHEKYCNDIIEKVIVLKK